MSSAPSPILDAQARPMQRASYGSPAAHSGADRFSQDMARWNPHMGSADSDYLPERDDLVARSRDIARNNGWASGLMQRYVDEAIGAEFRLSWRPDWRALGVDFKVGQDFVRRVEARWRAYATDPRNYCDAGESTTFSGLMGLGFRQKMLEGETLMLPRWIERTGAPYCTAFQMVDPDRLSNPHDAPDSDTLRGGKEINAYGAPVAYHIRAAHPGDWMSRAASPDRYRWERIPARTPWGRAKVIHHFEADRAGQTRGKGILSPILEKLKMLDRYEKTEMQAALVNAIFAAFIESPFDHTLMGDALDGDQVSSYQDGRAEFHDGRRLQLDGVRIPTLYPGEKFNMNAVARPNAAFPDFERTCLRYVAVATGGSYEQLSGDWSQTNYSSARAALLQAWKFMTARRGSFGAGVATQAFALWLEEDMDVSDDWADLPADIPPFWEAPGAWTRSRWLGPGRGWVDPVKEAQASQIRMDSGLSTLQAECAEQGLDWEEVIEQKVYELEYLTERGLSLVAAPTSLIEEDADQRDKRERDEAGNGGAS